MTAVFYIIAAAAIFGICRLVDMAFTKKFRSKAQHMSGLAVRANKRYGIFGVLLVVMGIAAVTVSKGDKLLLAGGILVFLLGAALTVHYLSFGVFYDGESFLLSRFGKKSLTYRFGDIQSQNLYLITGGSVVIDLNMADGSTVSLQSTMDGIYPFMDAAFAAWCMQTGRNPQDCDFYDPSKSWWFPHQEEG